MMSPAGRLTRRQWLRGVGLVAGAAVAGSALDACGQAASPTAAASAITLHFAPNWQGAAWNATALSLNQQWFDANYRVKGVRVQVHERVQGLATQQIAATIANSGFMDVFQDCCQDLVAWRDSGLLLPLDSYMQQDNVSPALWSRRHMQVLNYGGQQLALPAYDGPCTVFYRQDILDGLGLSYPNPDWTVAEMQKAAAAATGTSPQGQKRIGFYLLNNAWWGQINWLLAGWGASEMNADATVALMDTPGAVQMASFLQDGVRGGYLSVGGGVTALAEGKSAFQMLGGWSLYPAATQLGSSTKWDILPMPLFPAGRSTFDNIDFYAVNANTPHKEAAWELLRFVTAEPEYQRWQIKVTLIQPCLLSLWDEWEADIKAAAPPLQQKQLGWIKDAAVGGYAWPNLFFKYNAAQVDNLLISFIDQIWNGQLSPQLGMQELTQQINALQQSGAAAPPPAGFAALKRAYAAEQAGVTRMFQHAARH